jgi:heme A synthase
VADKVALAQRRTAAVAGAGGRQLALGIISLVAFIPISIVLGVNGDLLALLVTLLGIVGVNLAHAWQSRGH